MTDFTAVKQRQQATWASVDFAVIGTTLQIVGEQLAEAADVRAGEKVLDVAAGNGNATLAAARRFARVTSTDYVPELLDKGAERAMAEGLDVDFQVADAENQPFEDRSFDVVLSTFGVMFAPDQPRAAAEMARVVRPGGRIGLASWTRAGFLGELFQVIAKYAPPPPGVPSPMQWGDEEQLRHLFKHTKVHAARRNFMFRYQSPQHWIEIFRKFYGPIHKAFGALDASGQQHLYDDLEALLKRRNTAGAASLVVPGEYLEAVVTLR
jgi:ubiquinone/menaquinone biosynthesis C-methylase UbiE